MGHHIESRQMMSGGQLQLHNIKSKHLLGCSYNIIIVTRVATMNSSFVCVNIEQCSVKTSDMHVWSLNCSIHDNYSDYSATSYIIDYLMLAVCRHHRLAPSTTNQGQVTILLP